MIDLSDLLISRPVLMQTFRINESDYKAINTFVTAVSTPESESKVRINEAN